MRLRFALAAAVPTLALVAARTVYGACYPLCAIYHEGNPEYWLFFCYLC
jgi:hypothetical protein